MIDYRWEEKEGIIQILASSDATNSQSQVDYDTTVVLEIAPQLWNANADRRKHLAISPYFH